MEKTFEKTSVKPFTGIIIFCFFLSGLLTLIYEILWARLITRFIGTSPYTETVILAVFMSNLAIGAYLSGKWVDRCNRPLKLLKIYASLEYFIALYGLLLPGFIHMSLPIAKYLYNSFLAETYLYRFLIFVLIYTLFGLPVMAMGAIFPFVSRYIIVLKESPGAGSGLVYGLNTLGSAAGALLAGFFLIGAFGVKGSLHLVFGLNIAVAITVHIMSALLEKRTACFSDEPDGGDSKLFNQKTENSERTEEEHSWERRRPALVRDSSARIYENAERAVYCMVFAVLFISGFSTMLMEIIWTKLAGLLAGPTHYSFSIVVAIFITGLGLGAIIFGRLADRVEKPLFLLGTTQVLAAISILFASQILGTAQLFFSNIIMTVKDSFPLMMFLISMLLFLIMIVPTLLFGATYPVSVRVLSESFSGTGKLVAYAYAINTAGSVSGVLAGGFLMIPLLGKKLSISLMVAIQLSFALFLLIHSVRDMEKRISKFAGVIFCIAAAGLVTSFFFPRWDISKLSVGRYERLREPKKKDEWLPAERLMERIQNLTPDSGELLYSGDGIGGLVAVKKIIDITGNPLLTLYINGKADASNRADMSTQVLSAHVPLLLHPDPKKVMILGLGSGITAGEALNYSLEKLDIVEISREVVEASRYFEPWSGKIIEDPRVELIVEDGRAHIALTDRKYDVIISEPSNPWMAGLAALFTEDFYRQVHEKLEADGIFVQFLHSYQMDFETFSIMGRTFQKVFPEALLVNASFVASDYLLVGFKVRKADILANIRKNSIHAGKSRNAEFKRPEVILKLVLSDELSRVFGDGITHTDDKPVIELKAPRLMYTSDASISGEILIRKSLSRTMKDILEEISGPENQLFFAALALSLFKPFPQMFEFEKAPSEYKMQFLSLLEKYASRYLLVNKDFFPDKTAEVRCLEIAARKIEENLEKTTFPGEALKMLGNIYGRLGFFDRAIESLEKALEYGPADIYTGLALATSYAGLGRDEKARIIYMQLVEKLPVESYLGLAELDERSSRFAEAAAHYRKVLEHLNNSRMKDSERTREALVLGKLGTALGQAGKFDQALTELEKATELLPENAALRANLGNVYLKKKMIDKAWKEFEKALELDPYLQVAHENLILISLARKDYISARAFLRRANSLGVMVSPEISRLVSENQN